MMGGAMDTHRSGKFQDFPAILLGAPFLQSLLDATSSPKWLDHWIPLKKESNSYV